MPGRTLVNDQGSEMGARRQVRRGRSPVMAAAGVALALVCSTLAQPSVAATDVAPADDPSAREAMAESMGEAGPGALDGLPRDGHLVRFDPQVGRAAAETTLASSGVTVAGVIDAAGDSPTVAHVYGDPAALEALAAADGVADVLPNVLVESPETVASASTRSSGAVATGGEGSADAAEQRAQEQEAREQEARESAVQTSAPWGLDRIDQRSSRLNGGFDVAADGTGVTAYVIDSGVRGDHVDFGGRVQPGVSFVGGTGTTDCRGHGTHVAGTIGSATYGVAKNVTIVPVRTGACDGVHSTFNLINGLTWVVNHHQPGQPAVLNMSITGPLNLTLETFVTNVIEDGVTVVVAAGNQGMDACAYSPAGAPDVVSVGASNWLDVVTGFSNQGGCVDVFAPGEDITSTYHLSTVATAVLDGTSMASPHVAGIVALMLQREPALTPAQVLQRLRESATRNSLGGLAPGTPNLMAYVAPGSYVPLEPGRLMDTRPGGSTVDGEFAGIGARAGGQVTELQVAGRGGVPVDASAAVLNVTVTGAPSDGFVTVFPCGTTMPLSSSLNYWAGATLPNAVVSKIGVGGRVCVYTSTPAQLVVDVNGYHPSRSGFVAITPARLMDTRLDGVTFDGFAARGGLRLAGYVTELRVTGRGGVPSNAGSVVLNLTVTGSEGSGYVTVYPCGEAVPLSSNVNFWDRSTISNAVVSRLGTNGSICLFTSGFTHFVVDVTGYHLSGSSYSALTPARLMDTRLDGATIDGLAARIGQRASMQVTELQVTGRGLVPADASAVVLNVTVTNPVAAGYLTVFPCGTAVPNSSNLNFERGMTIPNAVIAKVGAGGRVCLLSNVATDVVVDVNGFAPG
jgi:subtilisin family serine protease